MTDVTLGRFELRLAEGYGPRVLGLRSDGGPQLFAELGDMTLPHPREPYLLGGGHRLWVGPEEPDLTYWPESGPAIIEEGPPLVVRGPEGGPVAKAIAVEEVGDALVVTHTVTNRSDGSMTVAPWAITQLVPGGEAVMAVGTPGNGYQAENVLVTWPYTQLDDPGLRLGGNTARLSGSRSSPIKIGTPAEGRALAYAVDGWVFTKAAAPSEGRHVDRGATAQIYANHAFVELETLGPLVDLGAGASAEHREVWRVFRLDGSVDELAGRLTDLGWPP